jgi:death-on-curing protein
VSQTYAYPDLADAQDICQRLGLRIRDAGALASALERPSQVVWGEEAYDGLHAKGAALLDAINRSHPLHDGNKRLSIVLTMLLYAVNGYLLVIDPDEGDTYIRDIAGDEHLQLDDIAKWLEAHAKAL